MSRDAFNRSLYLEHFEELSSLYDARRANLANLGWTMRELGRLEERMEAHLDGLEIGGAPAVDIALENSSPTDPASLYARTCVMCRLDRWDLVEELLDELEEYCSDESTEPADAELARRAITDGLVHHLPVAWRSTVVGALAEAGPNAAPVLAACVGYHRLDAAEALRKVAMQACEGFEAVIRAIPRASDERSVLTREILGEETSTAMLASVGSLRMGDMTGVQTLQSLARSETWPLVPLSMCASGAFLPHLLATARRGFDRHVLTALGLLGEPEAIETLVDGLRHPEFAQTAAWSLFLITGGGLQLIRSTSADDPDAQEPEDDPGDEDESPRAQGPTIKPDVEGWMRWLEPRRAKFTNGLRHRLGIVATPATDISAMGNLHVPLSLRRYLADEFVVRYRIDVGFEPDALALQQLRAIGSARSQLEADNVVYKPGEWYFQGRVVGSSAQKRTVVGRA